MEAEQVMGNASKEYKVCKSVISVNILNSSNVLTQAPYDKMNVLTKLLNGPYSAQWLI